MGRVWALIEMEARRLLKFPVVELIAIPAVFYIFRGLMSFDESRTFIGLVEPGSLQGLLREVAGSLIVRGLISILGSYTFISFIYAALTSSIARDISTGYMRFLLSQPFRRSEVFVAKLIVSFLTPLIVYFSVYSISIVAVGGLIVVFMNLLNLVIGYVIVLTLFLYVFSICLCITLITKESITSLISSLLFLYGVEYTVRMMKNHPVQYFIPSMCLWNFLVRMRCAESTLPWLSVIVPLVLSIALIAICYIYFTRRLEV